MREHYDFSKAKRNPYARRLKQQVTIRLDHDTVKYFKRLAEETGIGYQTLINLYLRECVSSGKKLSNTWRLRRRAGHGDTVATRYSGATGGVTLARQLTGERS